MGVSVLNLGILNFCFKSISLKICETLGVVKRTPKSLRPNLNYPKLAVANNLPRNINILETFDDNELLKRYRLWFGGYPNSKFLIISLIYSCSHVQFGFLSCLHVLLSAMIILLC